MARPDRPRSSRRVVAAVLMAAGTFSGAVLAPASASAATSSLAGESFSGASVPAGDWVAPAGGSMNLTCLTASADVAATPIPGCQAPALDPAGSGVLRLTPDGYGQVGTVYSTTTLPTAQGLEAHFDTYQWHGSGADGLSFIMAASDPAAPQAPTAVGPSGGALGYSAVPSRSADGVPYGYLGVGLDVYGSFSHSSSSGSGCPTTTSAPDTIAVRGPGNGQTGYCLVSSAATGVGGLDAPTATARPAPVPVEVAVNPVGAAAVTTAWGLVVPGGQFAVSVRTLSGTTTSMTGALPSVAGLGFPASWYDPTTGLPHQLAFGWAASSGGYTENHEVGGFTARTLTGPQPVLGATIDTDRPDGLIAGQGAVVRVRPTLSASGGPLVRALQVTATFPTGVDPTPGPFTTAAGYDCTGSGSGLRCTWTPATPVPAGSALPVLQLPISVPSGTAAGAYPVSAVVSSTDSVPVRTSAALQVTRMTAAVGSAVVVYGSAQTVSVAGLPSSATGSVVFSAGSGSRSCTVPDVTAATTCSIPSGDVGPVSVSATYRPAATSPYGAVSASAAYAVGQLASSVVLAPTASTYGTDVVLAVAGLPAGATGELSFTDEDGALLCVVPDVSAASSCSGGASLVAARHLVTATYAGDGNVLGSATSAALTVSKAAPVFTARSARMSSAGALLTVQVAGLPTDATGTLTVRSAGAVVCTATLPALSCSAPGPSSSAPVLDVDYSGDANYLPATVQARGPESVTGAPGQSPATSAGPDAALARTGSPAALGLAAGALLLTAGLLVLVAGRRRRLAGEASRTA